MVSRSAGRAFRNDPRRTSVGHRWVDGVVPLRDGGVRDHNHVVKLCPDPALCSSAASGFHRQARGLSDLIRSYPEDETDHRTAFDSPALISGRVSPWPGGAIRFGQLMLEGSMSLRNAAALAVWSKQIDPDAPQLRAFSDPMHGVMLPNRSRPRREEPRLGQCSGMTPDGRRLSRMTVTDKIKAFFKRQPPTDEELAARAEAESEQDRIRTEFGNERNPTQVPPP